MSTAPNSSRSSSSASASASSTKQTSSSVSTSNHQNNKEHQQEQDNHNRTKAPTTFDSFAFCNSPQEVTSITKELLQQANKKNNMITATSITLLLVTLRDTAKSAESVFWMIKLLLSLFIIKKQNTDDECNNNKNTRTSLLVSNTFLNNPDLLCSSLQASSEYIKQNDGFLFWFMSLIKQICTTENEKLQKLLVSNEDFMLMLKELETHALHEQTKLIFSELNKNVFEKPENKFEWLQVLCRKRSIPEFPQTILKILSQQMIRRQTFFALTEERLMRMKIPYGAILDMLTIIDGGDNNKETKTSSSATAMLSTSKKTKSIATAEQQHRGEEEKVVVVELNE